MRESLKIAPAEGKRIAAALPRTCICCGSGALNQTDVLWPELIAEWEISVVEVAYINLQQGFHCTECGNNLRAMALARAIIRTLGGQEPLTRFVESDVARTLRLLEVNEAGRLTPILRRLPGHVIVTYPETDIEQLPFDARTFDVVVHSDTLEHIARPIIALQECRRVLDIHGFVALTVPVIIGRLTRQRVGLPPSYHGSPGSTPEDQRVHTEYGADVWLDVMNAGFDECRILSVAPPAAHALICLG